MRVERAAKWIIVVDELELRRLTSALPKSAADRSHEEGDTVAELVTRLQETVDGLDGDS